MEEVPMSSLNTEHSPLSYVSVAQNRHDLKPQKQTQALLRKQIFHSSFTPRYWKDLQSLRVTLSLGMLLRLSNADAALFPAQEWRCLLFCLFSGIITGFHPKEAQVGLPTWEFLVVESHRWVIPHGWGITMAVQENVHELYWPLSICWVPNTCQALLQVLRIQQWTRQTVKKKKKRNSLALWSWCCNEWKRQQIHNTGYVKW